MFVGVCVYVSIRYAELITDSMKDFTCASSSRLQHVPFSTEPSLFPIKIHHNPQGPLGHSKILT